ncbi:ATP-binding protein [Candidatus Micrarchaeota archaeon]|nr:ATP-binding protein [Candidatus Micrarchaeota archaeon]
MRFIDRVAELKELRELQTLSERRQFTVAIYGLRRVGKTRLLLEFLKDSGIYFFVNKNKTSADLLAEFSEILRKNGILKDLEVLDSWDKFFEIIATRKTPPIVFDEFQNFAFVEPMVFGILQKTIDLNEDKPGLIILSGSLIGLMKKLFKGSKEPLYGRIKKSKKIEPLTFSACLEIAQELKLTKENLLKTHMLFGGYPKYYVSMEDNGLEGKTAEQIIEALFLAKDAPLEDEVNSILSQEFGGRSGTYYSILEAIATGNNTLSSIAGYLNTPSTSITRQLNELKDLFELIELEMPYSGKRGFYRIRHPLLEFWFSQIYKNYSDYVARRPEFLTAIKKNLNSTYGRCFEKVAKEFLTFELKLLEAKRQWGKNPDAEKGKNAYEIDLIGKDQKTTYAFEFKWQELGYSEAINVLMNLENKAKYVPKLPANTKFGIVAKKIGEKQKIKSAGYLAYDLDDFY